MKLVACCFQGGGSGDDAPAAICPAPPRESEAAARGQVPVPASPGPPPHASAARSIGGAHESMGSLTAWQLLAADVAAHPPSSGRGSTAAPSTGRRRASGPHRLREESDWPSGRGSTSHRLEAYDVLGSIGSGAFGTAQQAVRRNDGHEVCIKQLNTGVMSWRQQEAVCMGWLVLGSWEGGCRAEGAPPSPPGRRACHAAQAGGRAPGTRGAAPAPHPSGMHPACIEATQAHSCPRSPCRPGTRCGCCGDWPTSTLCSTMSASGRAPCSTLSWSTARWGPTGRRGSLAWQRGDVVPVADGPRAP